MLRHCRATRRNRNFLIFVLFLFAIVIVCCSLSENGTFGRPEAVPGDNVAGYQIKGSMVTLGMQLGDRKPSRLLLEMRSKTGNRISEELLKYLFLQRLPTHMQKILAISNDNPDGLAEMA
ncbi:hypothetical protein AVEN_228248-1 [Araneus ventricosus]|uniref:Uncharacterized protein n=1 Tax=Araneus ventricosus TaxID=182803 RepID=A0A4Y2KJR1_ARAVE|nr:hypothetical protein AVEN_228248-1 [Araneus ventricosus]